MLSCFLFYRSSCGFIKPLPSNVSTCKGSSDDFIDANIQLAVAVVRKLKERKGTRVCIVFPYQPEKHRASELFKSAFDLVDGIAIGSFDDVPSSGPVSSFRSIRNTLDFDFNDEVKIASRYSDAVFWILLEGCWQSNDPPSLYMFINCSTRELAAIEKYVDKFAISTPAALFNLELDTLRSYALFSFNMEESCSGTLHCQL